MLWTPIDILSRECDLVNSFCESIGTDLEFVLTRSQWYMSEGVTHEINTPSDSKKRTAQDLTDISSPESIETPSKRLKTEGFFHKESEGNHKRKREEEEDSENRKKKKLEMSSPGNSLSLSGSFKKKQLTVSFKKRKRFPFSKFNQ